MPGLCLRTFFAGLKKNPDLFCGQKTCTGSGDPAFQGKNDSDKKFMSDRENNCRMYIRITDNYP